MLTGPELDRLLAALADFVDLKCPFMLGHSRGVAALAASAAQCRGLAPDQVGLLRRAGFLHDLGRIGVSSQIWEKPGPLTAAGMGAGVPAPLPDQADSRPGPRSGSRGSAGRESP